MGILHKSVRRTDRPTHCTSNQHKTFMREEEEEEKQQTLALPFSASPILLRQSFAWATHRNI
jgi:hypothetical protein